MSVTEGNPASSEVAAEAAAITSPNQYHLSGDGISVSYFPDGLGPIGPAGATRLIYQDGSQQLKFTSDELRIVPVEDLGTWISVTLVRTVDTGYTSFSLLLPEVVLAGPNASARVDTVGVTTVHRAFVARIGHAQVETYTEACLSGTAARGPLPM
jgi:hypothetical protein